MSVFRDRLKFGSTAALDYRTGQNKGRDQEKDLLLLLVFLLGCASNVYSFRFWQFLGSLFSKICVENSNSNEVQFDETTFILLSIAKSNITLRGYKLQPPPKNVNTVIFCC